MRSPNLLRALLVLALLVLAHPALGQARVGDVEVNVERLWPAHLGKGWVPVMVDLENQDPEAVEVEVVVTNPFVYAGSKEVRQTVELQPREQQRLEVLFPLLDGTDRHGGLTAHLQVRVHLGSSNVSLDVGGEEWENRFSPMMVFGASRMDSRDRSSLSRDIETAVDRPQLGVRIMGPHTSVDIGSGRYADMARHWSAYSSLYAVLLDLDGGTPDPERFEDLMRWVRLGGTVVLAGDPKATLASAPSLEGAFETRFVLGEHEGITVYQVGLGRLYRVDGARGLDNAPVHRAVRSALAQAVDMTVQPGRAYVPAPGTWRLGAEHWTIPGVGRLPLRTFMMLLLLFAFAIGPVNMVVLKRIGRPALLLVTIPVLSILASVGLVLYGVLHQGIDTKAARVSVTHLDQRTSRAAIVERRRLYVGLAQGTRLMPGAGTSVFPEEVSYEDHYGVERDGSVRLTGAFLPVREEVDQMVLTERAARSGLELKIAGNGVEVTNSFDAALFQVVVRAPNGTYHVLDETLAPGESGQAQPFVRESGEHVISRRLSRHRLYHDLDLVPGSYAALLADNPLADDCGLDMNVKLEEHLVLGVVEANEEAWR